MKKKNKYGYVSLEIVIIFAIVFIGGFVSVNTYAENSKDISQKTETSVNDAIDSNNSDSNGSGSNSGSNTTPEKLVNAPLYDSYIPEVVEQLKDKITGVNTTEATKILMNKNGGSLPKLAADEKSLLKVLTGFTDEQLDSMNWKFIDVKNSTNNKTKNECVLAATLSSTLNNVNTPLVYYNGHFYGVVQTTPWKDTSFITTSIVNTFDFNTLNNAMSLDKYLSLSKEEKISLGISWAKIQ